MIGFRLAGSVGVAALVLLLGAAPGPVLAAPDPEALKVCADSHNLPFSDKEEQGFENALARLMAKEFGLPLKYSWFPQRRGFIRNTLKSELRPGLYKCDLVLGVSKDFEQAATTRPYYYSTYALVFAKGRGLDGLTQANQMGELDEATKKKIRLGVFDLGPGQIWVFNQGMMDYAVPYVAQPGHVKDSLARILDDIVADKLDAAVVWGPLAGYYATKKAPPGVLKVLPLESDPLNPQMRFHFGISMAVRYGEKEWKARVNEFITKNREEIHAILEEYGVPLVQVEE